MRTPTHIFSETLAGYCYIILAIMVFCTTQQVITRFTSNTPSTVFDEFTQILSTWVILSGGVYTTGLRKHLAIDLLTQRFSAASVLTLNSFIQITITIFVITFMTCGGNIVVERAQHAGQISPVLKWPMDKVYWVMPANGLILVWCSVMNIIDNYHKWNSH